MAMSFQANVVCRQLGFPNGAASAPCCSAYGQAPTNFSYDDVGCIGTETTLDACPHLNIHNCGSTEGAGVVCNTGTSTGNSTNAFVSNKMFEIFFTKRFLVDNYIKLFWSFEKT